MQEPVKFSELCLTSRQPVSRDSKQKFAAKCCADTWEGGTGPVGLQSWIETGWAAENTHLALSNSVELTCSLERNVT